MSTFWGCGAFAASIAFLTAAGVGAAETPAAAPAPARLAVENPVVIGVDAPVLAAVEALGPQIRFFTPRARPLRSLAELKDPARQVGTGELSLARSLHSMLKAGGVPYGGGAIDLMQLLSEHHYPALFRTEKDLRLFASLARQDGAEAGIVARGGGVPLVFRARGAAAEAGAPTGRPVLTAAVATPGADGGIGGIVPASSIPTITVTSFGPLVKVERSDRARVRQFDPQEGPRREWRTARPGHQFVVVHIDRDFSAGVGTVSYLFGAGVVLKPAFERLVVADGRGRRHQPVVVFAEGRTVELGYEIQAARGPFALSDGETILPLRPDHPPGATN